MKVVFGINAARGMVCVCGAAIAIKPSHEAEPGPRNDSATGPWYGDNARELMTYVHDSHPTCVYAWEFGKYVACGGT